MSDFSSVSLPCGTVCHHYASLDSTNSQAARDAMKDAGVPMWILADTQHAGRGRRGRVWKTLQGNLAATLLLAPSCPASLWGQISFVMALAAHHAIVAALPPRYHSAVSIKWPNDILISGEKVAGILLEAMAANSSKGVVTHLAVGVGINLVKFPTDVDYAATSVKQARGNVKSALEMLAILSRAFYKYYDMWNDGQGFKDVCQGWLSHAYKLGETISLRVGTQCHEGIFEGINDAGAVLLRCQSSGRLRSIMSGDVMMLTTPS